MTIRKVSHPRQFSFDRTLITETYIFKLVLKIFPGMELAIVSTLKRSETELSKVGNTVVLVLKKTDQLALIPADTRTEYKKN